MHGPSLRFFRRRPYEENCYSIEELFQTIARHLNDCYRVDTVTMPCLSKGVLKRVINMLFAWSRRRELNHITGDVHYLGIVLSSRNTVLTIHDCGELQRTRGFLKFILWLFWFYWPVKRLNYITVVSEQTKKDLLQAVKVDPNKIRVIYNCLIGEYKKKTAPFDESKPRILQVGTTPNKNLARIAEALKGIRCTLVILGQPPLSSMDLLKQAGVDYEIHRGLNRSAVSELYARSDLLLFPSTLEGFGLPIIEAQASGIPVITSNISAMPEVAGSGACLVDPFDAASIRAGVEKLISDASYRDHLVREGNLNVQRFDPREIANQYSNLYREIIPLSARPVGSSGPRLKNLFS